jgi:S-adenosylmethionine-diacylglycerol 3-amino-3-carboxypropyl transferase
MAKRVELYELLFAQSWEDPELDRAALAMKGARVATVASGGCNALTFLLDDPAHVLAFDYNPTQVWLLELKKGAFRSLAWEELLELFGVRESQGRASLLARALEGASGEARRYWSEQRWVVERGVLNGGRYERFVRAFQLLLRAIHGKRKLRALFEERTREQRAVFYDKEWDTIVWRILFRAFFNKRALARRGLSADYFHFSDGSTSFAESFARRTKRALVELDVRSNPFVAQYVLGRYLDEDHLPLSLRRESFDAIRTRLDRLEARVGDVRTVFDGRRGEFDAICLSNVFELMSAEETAAVLPRVAGALRPGGRMTLRNLMVPRCAGSEVAGLLERNTSRGDELCARDRSFVYSSFQAYAGCAERSAGVPQGQQHVARAQ